MDVSVYFKPETEEDDIFNIQNRLESLSEVKEVVYISEDEALENFKTNHADDQVILESLEELDENPLSATLIVKANTIEDYDSIISVLDNPDYEALIRDRNFEDNEDVITKLSELSNKIERIGIIISVVFVIIAILIVFNTIRINLNELNQERCHINFFLKQPLSISNCISFTISIFQ